MNLPESIFSIPKTADESVKYPEVGTRNFFFSPQSQFRNLKEALPQLQFRNFLRNVSPQPQLRNSEIAIFS
jgi:hypothetical protein